MVRVADVNDLGLFAFFTDSGGHAYLVSATNTRMLGERAGVGTQEFGIHPHGADEGVIHPYRTQ
jgi:hypothetical protein